MIAGFSPHQHRVLAQLGLTVLRRRPIAGAAPGFVLHLDLSAPDLLEAILRWMPDDTVAHDEGGVRLAFDVGSGDALGTTIELSRLRQGPALKRALWRRQCRLRRSGDG